MLPTRMASNILFPTHQKEHQILMGLHLLLPTLHLTLPTLHLLLPILHLQLLTHHHLLPTLLLPTLHNLLPTLHLPSLTLLHTEACQQQDQHPIPKGRILLLALLDMEDPLHPLQAQQDLQTKGAQAEDCSQGKGC